MFDRYGDGASEHLQEILGGESLVSRLLGSEAGGVAGRIFARIFGRGAPLAELSAAETEPRGWFRIPEWERESVWLTPNGAERGESSPHERFSRGMMESGAAARLHSSRAGSQRLRTGREEDPNGWSAWAEQSAIPTRWLAYARTEPYRGPRYSSWAGFAEQDRTVLCIASLDAKGETVIFDDVARLSVTLENLRNNRYAKESEKRHSFVSFHERYARLLGKDGMRLVKSFL